MRQRRIASARGELVKRQDPNVGMTHSHVGHANIWKAARMTENFLQQMGINSPKETFQERNFLKCLSYYIGKVLFLYNKKQPKQGNIE